MTFGQGVQWQIISYKHFIMTSKESIHVFVCVCAVCG